MRATQKRLIVMVMLCWTAGLFAAGADTKVQNFEYWGILDKLGEGSDHNPYKLVFVMGFTNGLITGANSKICADATAARPLLGCLFVDERLHISLSTDQAIAMIDKYYRDHPERWSISIGDAILEALTVSGSPCARMVPTK